MPFVPDRFVIGFWPPVDFATDERCRTVAEAGFNLVPLSCPKQDPMTRLRRLRKCGLRAILWPEGSDPAKWPRADNLWGFALKDEPGAAEFPALRERAEGIERHHPGKLAYVNLFPDYATPGQLGAPDYETYVKRFVDICKPDVLSMDHYPIFRPEGGDGRDGYCRNLASFRKAALEAKLPFWNFFNTMPYGPHTDPTESQLRWQVFASIAYGAKGVMYFCYDTPQGDEFPKGGAVLAVDGKKGRHYEQAKRLNATLNAYGPTLMKLTSTGVYRIKPADDPAAVLRGSGMRDIPRGKGDPPGDYLVGAFRHQDGRRAVFLQNYHFAYSAWPTVVFDAPIEAVREIDPLTGREIAVYDESPALPGTQISLADGEGRLFLLPA